VVIAVHLSIWSTWASTNDHRGNQNS